MVVINLIFSLLLLITSTLWVGRTVHRAWVRYVARRNFKVEDDDFWTSESETPRRRPAEDYAGRHRHLYENNDNAEDPWDDSAWQVRRVSLPHRCEICHQSDQFDPVTLRCGRCDHYTH